MQDFERLLVAGKRLVVDGNDDIVGFNARGFGPATGRDSCDDNPVLGLIAQQNTQECALVASMHSESRGVRQLFRRRL